MNSFGDRLDAEYIIHSFPAELRKDVEEVVRFLPFDHHILLHNGERVFRNSLIYQETKIVSLAGEQLAIPIRVYFKEPDTNGVAQLTKLHQSILYCIYLRHFNGYVRQRALEKLLDIQDYFVIPFTIQLLGEYVMEIIEVLDKHINDTTIDLYLRFIDENPECWRLTEAHMISFWNEKYRHQIPNYKNYIGYHIVKRIKEIQRARLHNYRPKG